MNEQKMAVLTLHRASDLTPKTKAWLAAWLRDKANEIEHGHEPYAKVFRASAWSGRGLGWRRSR